jgi:GTPase SAR1 family protein
MKTLLSRFCNEFGGALEPLVAPLRRFCETLEAAAASGVVGPEARPYVAGFQDIAHQLGVLAKKVADQQAYVLIFGPLKSGKSTLMNSIAASYVSEVTALPAYPCMVYVSHAPAREFVVTRYNGDTQIFTSPASMRLQVTRDHAELAERIRSDEAAGHGTSGSGGAREFDPALHFPQAIRRIDVHVPAEALEDSGAVLVDTPGLYSRMKFGYDRMTREFRNSAACAIFVVKTDNLFLEQVFQEFTELLGLFSRIFLVVNIDSTKMDLRPDGSLAPSLEREDPVRIVEAFETLSMSAALKRAVEDGRLVIHPVDLLRAASQRLSPGGARDERTSDFRTFLDDLTEYLNSTDYLVAFLGDSLRHGTALVDEGKALCRHRELERLATEAERLERERTRLVEELTAIERLGATDWRAAFEPLAQKLWRETESDGATLARSAQKGLRSAIDAWRASDDSLKALLDEELAPVLVGYQQELGGVIEGALRRAVQSATAGARLPEETARALERCGLPLGTFAAEGLVAVAPRAHVEKVALHVDVERLEVKKSWLDWLLFRSRTSIRRRLFGNAAHPANPIARAQKDKRFTDATFDALEDEVLARVDGFFEKVRRRVVDTSAREFREGLVVALVRTLDARRAAHQKDLARVAAQLGRLQEIAEGLARLTVLFDGTSLEVARLADVYGRTDAAQLVREDDSTLGADATDEIELTPLPRATNDATRSAVDADAPLVEPFESL